MNLKETVISSFFCHLILFLLMIAASNYTGGFQSSSQKSLMIDLAMVNRNDQPETRINAADKLPTEAGSLSSGEMSLPEQAADNPPMESKAAPEPEKKTEPVTEPAKIEKAETPPIRTEGFSSMEAYYQFILVHKKIFGQHAGARINELLGEALRVNKRVFYGGSAVVILHFSRDGRLKDVRVDSASPDLKAFFEEISWTIIPPPSTYSLGFTQVQITFTVLEGYMSFNINTL